MRRSRQSHNLKFTWALLAAGNSSRFGGRTSKLLEPISGKRLIDRTIESLRSSLPGAPIVLVSGSDLRDEIACGLEWTEGGARRQDSAFNGLRAAGNCDIVLMHDAARPFVSADLVARLLAALEDCDAAAPGFPVTDTIKKVKDGIVIETLETLETLQRKSLVAVQTPQAVWRDVAAEAFEAMPPDVEFTDDLAVISAVGGRVRVVEGDRNNIKITTRDDLAAAERILGGRKIV